MIARGRTLALVGSALLAALAGCGERFLPATSSSGAGGNGVGGAGGAGAGGGPSCGNGKVEANEQCDDGNSTNGDGCNAGCVLPKCQDGVADKGELCLLATPTKFPTTLPTSSWLFVGDGDGDGKPDVVAVSQVMVAGGKIVAFLKNNGGSLGLALTQTQSGPFSSVNDVAAADLDGKKGIEVAVAYNAPRWERFFFTGGFPLSSGQIPFADMTLSIYATAAADFDGDKQADPLWLTSTTGIDHVVRVDGSKYGTKTTPFAGFPTAAAAGDMNGDGLADVAWIDVSGSPVVAWRQGTSDGIAKDGGTAGVDDGASSIAVGDMDGDGNADFVVASETKNEVIVLRSSKTMLTALPAVSTLGDGAVAAGKPKGLALGDVDHDGDLDVATADFDGAVSVLLNDGKGKLTRAAQAAFPLVAKDFPRSVGAPALKVALADLDDNGALDLVVLLNTNDVAVLLANP